MQKVYDAEGNVTEDVSQAERVVTDYLSMANGESMMEEDDTLTENPNLLQPFDKESEISETNPDYRDVQIAFRVIESIKKMGNTSNSNRKWKRNNNTNRTYSRDGSRASGKSRIKQT